MRDGLENTCGGLKWPGERPITLDEVKSLLRQKLAEQCFGEASFGTEFDVNFQD